jgi:hypothetical protein
VAASSNRSFEDVVAEPPVESLPDAELLAVCDRTLPDAAQAEFSDLLAANRERILSASERERFDSLMAAYRRGLVFKARALKEAVARGLKQPLGDHVA